MNRKEFKNMRSRLRRYLANMEQHSEDPRAHRQPRPMPDAILADANFMMALLLNRHYKGNHKEGIPVYHVSNPEVPLCYTPKMTPKESKRASRFSVPQKVEFGSSRFSIRSSRFSMP